MRQIIDIKVPTCWQQLSDKQLRFVFKLLNGNFSLPQVKALCLLKWAKMKILRREGSIFIMKYNKQTFPVTALQITEVTQSMEWLGDFPGNPDRLLPYIAAPVPMQSASCRRGSVCKKYPTRHLPCTSSILRS